MNFNTFFDEKVKFVSRLNMSRVLCIDEIRFSEKFVCVLIDFNSLCHQKTMTDEIHKR